MSVEVAKLPLDKTVLKHVEGLGFRGYGWGHKYWQLCLQPRTHALLGGSGDLVTRLIMGIIGVSIWVIGVLHLRTKSP